MNYYFSVGEVAAVSARGDGTQTDIAWLTSACSPGSGTKISPSPVLRGDGGGVFYLNVTVTGSLAMSNIKTE